MVSYYCVNCIRSYYTDLMINNMCYQNNVCTTKALGYATNHSYILCILRFILVTLKHRCPLELLCCSTYVAMNSVTS